MSYVLSFDRCCVTAEFWTDVYTDAFHLPLFAVAKQIQRKWPSTLRHRQIGCDARSSLLPNGHPLLKMLGDWLQGSKWVSLGTALIQSRIISPGTANSFQRATHHTINLINAASPLFVYPAIKCVLERQIGKYGVWCLVSRPCTLSELYSFYKSNE